MIFIKIKIKIKYIYVLLTIFNITYNCLTDAKQYLPVLFLAVKHNFSFQIPAFPIGFSHALCIHPEHYRIHPKINALKFLPAYI